MQQDMFEQLFETAILPYDREGDLFLDSTEVTVTTQVKHLK